MRLFGLIGNPLEHSLSQKYFSEKFKQLGIQDCVYKNFELESISKLKEVLSLTELVGLNITIPYKEQVLPFLDYQSEGVKKAGACNCIHIHKGKIKGYNTDVTGFKKSILKKLNPEKHYQALILGTGGASKAVQLALRELGINYKLVSRVAFRETLSYEQLDASIIQQHKLIINTTPLGLYPKLFEMPPIPYKHLSGDHFLFDVIANPEETKFLKKGKEQGAITQNGLEMFQIQAEESWRIWNNDGTLLI